MQIAVDMGCCRMQWQVLDWNTRAMDLYVRMGGKVLKEWITVRMSQPDLAQFATGGVPPKKVDSPI